MHKTAGHRGYYMYMAMQRYEILIAVPNEQISFIILPLKCNYPQFIFYILSMAFLTHSNCIQLQRLLQEIKQHQDSSSPQHQQLIADLMSLLHHRSLDLTNPDNVTLWAGCCVGLLRASESTVNLPHLTLADEQVSSPLNPQSVCVLSNCSNTAAFMEGLLHLP